MKTLCQYTNKGTCLQCGLPISSNERRMCRAAVPGLSATYSQSISSIPRARLGPSSIQKHNEPCPHLLGPIVNQVARVFNCGCPSEKTNGIETTVCECELYGLCTLWSRIKNNTYIEPDNIRFCTTCGDNPKNKHG